MNRSCMPKAWRMEMFQITDEATRIQAMAVEYRAAYSAGNTERLRIICQRIDEQYREQFPEAGPPPQKREPEKIVPMLPPPLAKAG
jgi:hypothetical protein